MLVDASQRNSKIPFDEEGIAALEQVLRDVTERGENAQHFRAGESTFTIPTIAELDPADVAARRITLGAEVVLSNAVEEVEAFLVVLTA